jgi:type IV pilus assembly protein PilP
MRQHKLFLLQHKTVNLPIICAVVLALLAGCSNDDFSDLHQYIKAIKDRPKGTIKPLPDNKTVEPFIFKPEDLRDPFKPLKPTSGGGTCPPDCTEPPTSGIKPDTSRRKEELEAFPIETLKMIGTVEMKSNLWGLIKATDNTVYRVRAGNYMGQNYGKIIRISADKIELMEIVPDKPGTWREQQMSVMLTDELGGK